MTQIVDRLQRFGLVALWCVVMGDPLGELIGVGPACCRLQIRQLPQHQVSIDDLWLREVTLGPAPFGQ